MGGRSVTENPEVWMPIPSAFGLYEASSNGRIRRINKKGPRIKAQFDGGVGYMSVFISTLNKGRRKDVHVLVCEAFHGPKPFDKDLVAHADGNPLNNSPSNLRWATFKENEDDKLKHGRRINGERIHTAALTEEKVRLVLDNFRDGKAIRKMARELGVSQRCIQHVVRRQTWRHVDSAMASTSTTEEESA